MDWLLACGIILIFGYNWGAWFVAWLALGGITALE
jgi:hypothetical protein